MKIRRWKGPNGWTGHALDGWREFPFHLLPWDSLSDKRTREGNITCVKDSDSRRVYRIDPAPAEGGSAVPVSEAVYAKRYLVNNLRRRMGRLISGSRAEREFRLGIEMVRSGLPTPTPLACAENLRASKVGNADVAVTLPPASYLLTRAWPGRASVPLYFNRHPGATEPMAFLVARFLSHLHARGFYHDDCSAEHFLLSPAIDLDAALKATAEGWTMPPPESPLAVIDIDNGSLDSSPLDLQRRLLNLFQVLRSLGGKHFPARARTTLIEEYIRRSGLEKKISLKEARAEIERIARRKAGRSVLKR